MNKPLTVLKAVEDVDNAPDGTVVNTRMGATITIETKEVRKYLKENLPVRVLRWGEDLYPTGFERVLKSLAQMKPAERENCHMAQCHVTGQLEPFVLLRIDDGENDAHLISKSGKLISPNLDEVIPFSDLPRMVWPGEEPQETPVVSEWVGRELRENYDTFRPATLLDEYQGAARIFDTWRDAMAYADEQARTVEVVLPRFNGKTRLPAHNGHPFGYTIDATQENYASAVHIFGAWGTMGICDMEDVEPIALTLLSARYKEKQ